MDCPAAIVYSKPGTKGVPACQVRLQNSDRYETGGSLAQDMVLTQVKLTVKALSGSLSAIERVEIHRDPAGTGDPAQAEFLGAWTEIDDALWATDDRGLISLSAGSPNPPQPTQE